MKIAFLYNIRCQYPDANNPCTQLETDFDDPVTVKTMIRRFKQCGYDVLPIEADQKAYLKLNKHKKDIELAFNYAEGIFGRDREAHLPAMLEMLQIPYTGSPPLTQAMVLNKAKTKEMLMANNIPTLPFQVFTAPDARLKRSLRFPLIVKPVGQGSSAGIVNRSVVYDEHMLRYQVQWIRQTFSQPALVEPFLSGREFSVAMLGNPPMILPIIEPNHAALPPSYAPIDSLEVKWYFEEGKTGEDYLMCPAQLDKPLKAKISRICYRTWESLGVLDWCRIDIRCNTQGNPYVLEVNSPAGMLPPEISQTSYFPLAARKAGIEYNELIQAIINTARKRYSLF